MGGGYLNVRWDPSSDPENWRIWSKLLRSLGDMIEELAPQFGFSNAFVEELLERERCGLSYINFCGFTEDEFNRMYKLLIHAHANYQDLKEVKDWFERGNINSMFKYMLLIESHLKSTDCDERLDGSTQTLVNPHRRKGYTDQYFHVPACVYFEIARRSNELDPRLRTELFRTADGLHSRPYINYVDMSADCLVWVRSVVADMVTTAPTDPLTPIFMRSDLEHRVEQGRVLIHKILSIMRYDPRYKYEPVVPVVSSSVDETPNTDVLSAEDTSPNTR
jgi:hypothetical protein